MNSLSRKHIELWVEARGGAAAINPVMRMLVQDLEASGAIVGVRVPEHEVVDPRSLLDASPLDLVLLKTTTTLSLSLALADESLGVKFLNRARDTLRVHDKAATVARLAAAGSRYPRPSWSSRGPTARFRSPARADHGSPNRPAACTVAASPSIASFLRRWMPKRLSMLKARTSWTMAPA